MVNSRNGWTLQFKFFTLSGFLLLFTFAIQFFSIFQVSKDLSEAYIMTFRIGVFTAIRFSRVSHILEISVDGTSIAEKNAKNTSVGILCTSLYCLKCRLIPNHHYKQSV
jgi:hypothetical protein